ncbi:hypothetical protein [Candidatus Solirubrobacter pratensis]|uniref:hypothetical protein n=1 Tax=Candidatus Solirubrobacter pratensis TaxID=1298857 RepID=UPI0004104795|nr:hypothetical protein [Candidatus Solirubrobacter pratensis]
MTRLLLNFFYAQPVGHAVEALHYANGYRLGGAGVSVALNAATPVELAGLCPWLEHAYAIDHPFLEPASDPAALVHVPREWDWVVDDVRRVQDFQLDLFPGMRGYYEASDAHFAARERIVTGAPRPPYVRHAPLRLELPPANDDDDRPLIAVMPAGSSERAL